jgi:hypothetical protein
MNLYLDDDVVSAVLIKLLRRTRHDVVTPADNGLSGSPDVRHLEFAIRSNRPVLTRNHHDFRDLHQLLATASGTHWGIFVVCYENDSKRDMTDKQVAAAVTKIEKAGIDVANQLVILNHWR